MSESQRQQIELMTLALPLAKLENHNKSVIINFFSAIIELVQEMVISNMHNKIG